MKIGKKPKKRLYEEKMKKRLEELRRNEKFNMLLDRIDQATSSSEKKELFDELSEKYGVDLELWESVHLLRKENEEMVVVASETAPSLCKSIDQYGLNFDPPFVADYYKGDLRMRTHIKAYPVSIDIHRLASREDVISFVDDNWKIIEPLLRKKSGQKRLDVRKRTVEDRDRFIYRNREKSPQEIQKLLKEQYKKKEKFLGTEEIKEIIRVQIRLRKRDLSGGR